MSDDESGNEFFGAIPASLVKKQLIAIDPYIPTPFAGPMSSQPKELED